MKHAVTLNSPHCSSAASSEVLRLHALGASTPLLKDTSFPSSLRKSSERGAVSLEVFYDMVKFMETLSADGTASAQGALGALAHFVGSIGTVTGVACAAVYSACLTGSLAVGRGLAVVGHFFCSALVGMMLSGSAIFAATEAMVGISHIAHGLARGEVEPGICRAAGINVLAAGFFTFCALELFTMIRSHVAKKEEKKKKK